MFVRRPQQQDHGLKISIFIVKIFGLHHQGIHSRGATDHYTQLIHNLSRSEVAVGAGCKGHPFGAGFKTENASSGVERKYGARSTVRIVRDRLCTTLDRCKLL